MMKRIIVANLMMAALSFCPSADAGEDVQGRVLCAFNDTERGAYGAVLGEPSPEAMTIIERIANIVGVENNFDVRSAEFPSMTPIAYATVYQGRRQIVYDREFFARHGEGRISWAEVGIYAHEIGHLLGTHVFLDDNRHSEELAADRFAGFIIARLGGSQAQATSMTRHFSANASSTHPARARRVEAIVDGWELGQRMMRAEEDAPR